MPQVRAAIANLVLYGNMIVWMVVCSPALLGPPSWALACIKGWAFSSLHLLRWTTGIKWEVRGLENLPKGGCIIACKHQSMWETFALFPYLDKPVYILKSELLRIPFFGWFCKRAGHISVERGQHAKALREMTKSAKAAVDRGGQLVIFPEGTRRAPGAAPAYKTGFTFLYKSLGVPMVPAALNSGLFWPRRRFQRYSGTIIVSLGPHIPAGEEAKQVQVQVVEMIEAETSNLISEALSKPNPPPLHSVNAAS